MILEAIELRRVRLPLVTPMVAAHGTETEREVVIVRTQGDDGRVGWGECPTLTRPTYTSEYTDGAWAVLRDVLAPALMSGPRLKVAGHRMAQAALRDAMFDLACEDRPAAEALHPLGGGEEAVRDAVPTTTVVGRQPDAAAAVGQVAAEVERGQQWVKLKVDPTTVDHVEAVRSTWPRHDLELAVDANGSLDPAAGEAVQRLDRLDLAYLEQPFAAEDLVACATWAERLATPITLDESISSAGSLEAALALGAAAAVNVKPARLGGTMAATAILGRARSAGVDVFVGGMLETGIGRAAALAVAAQPACTLPTDLGPSGRYFPRDLTEPFELNPDTTLTVPAGAGFGVDPDPHWLDQATMDRATFRR